MSKWRSLRGGWIIRMRNSEWCRKLVPEMRWSMLEGSMRDFEWWWWFDESDIRWSACVVVDRMTSLSSRVQHLFTVVGYVSYVSYRVPDLWWTLQWRTSPKAVRSSTVCQSAEPCWASHRRGSRRTRWGRGQSSGTWSCLRPTLSGACVSLDETSTNRTATSVVSVYLSLIYRSLYIL